MNSADKYGFNDPDLHDLKKVRIFIDKVLAPMGIAESLRVNPLLEKELYVELIHADMANVNFDTRPLIINGKVFDVKDEELIIEEKKQESNTKTYTRKKYTSVPDKEGVIKSTENAIITTSNGRADFLDIYKEGYSYFTSNGVEMSQIVVNHEGKVRDDVDFYNFFPEIPGNHISSGYKFDGQNNLEASKLLDDYSVYTKISRDPNFVEQAQYYSLIQDDEGKVESTGLINIHPEGGIAKLSVGSLDLLRMNCQKRNLTTGEVIPPQKRTSVELSTDELNKVITDSEFSIVIKLDPPLADRTYISPLQRRTIQELIEMSNGRATLDKYYMAENYKASVENLKATDLKEMLSVVSELAPDNKDINRDNQRKEEQEEQK